MDITKKKLKKLKNNEAIDIGEHGGETIVLKDDTNPKKKNRKSKLDEKNTDNEAEIEGVDITVSENCVKMLENKRKTVGKKKRKDVEVEHFKLDNDITTKKAERKKKNKEDKKNDDDLVEKAEKKKMKKKKDKERTGSDYQLQSGEIVNLVEKVGKKRKREKEKNEVQDVTDMSSNETQEIENTSIRGFEKDRARDKDVTKKSSKKQKTKEKGKESSIAEDDKDTKPVKQKKKVKFSDKVEVFPLSDNEGKVVRDKRLTREEDDEGKLVRGKRFTLEEDEIVKKAVNDYIEAHSLGEEGLNMVLNCRAHPQARHCWKEIAGAIPYRPKESVYHRAQILFRRSETTKWTKEEYKQIQEYQKKHGNQWKQLADELQKHRAHVKDTWRRIKLSNMKRGHWNQDEYQALFDMVNLDLKTRYKEEKKSQYGMLRDNICWTAISDKLTTRLISTCCIKWYSQLTSSLVSEGEWADADDYRLINALYDLDANCVDDVDWDNLLEHRSGDVCRKRWSQMTLHIGYHGTQSFSEQVEVLTKRYCPELIDVREEWDNKPYVD